MVVPMLVMAGLLSAVAGADVAAGTIYPMSQVPDWQHASTMKLSLSPPEDGSAVRLSYDVIPLTTSLGLNQTDRTRQSIHIHGNMVWATSSNYVDVTNSDTLAYLCCDDMSNSDNITPDMMIGTLMANKPKAILLYSTNGSCCGLRGSNLPYQTIFTMASSAEAGDALNLTSRGDGLIQATITGNISTQASDSQATQSGSNSAVAMSILYSITGLITLLFLIIIATGAIRAHRFPERYGPHPGHAGRPRQSRAKGIARAVLETLPIVKFGESNPPKPDPAIDLESTSHVVHDPSIGTRLSAIPEEPQSQVQRKSRAPAIAEEGASDEALAVSHAKMAMSTDNNVTSSAANTEHLGCSICTEDFEVGQDVRVLPCDHKFHPACVDPWLMNVSGTCPLCRLDLRPPQEKEEMALSEDLQEAPLPPPLDAEVHETSGIGSSSAQSNPSRRTSRLLDLHRLRHASVEERMDILRRHVSQPQQLPSSADGDPEDHSRRARMADRLRDRFRIHTRPQPASNAADSS